MAHSATDDDLSFEPTKGSVTRDDRHAFPRLSPEQIDRARRYGEEERLPSGSVIFKRGERKVDFFIVLSGRVEIYDDDVCADDGGPLAFHVHHERGFTGELDLFSGRKILVSGRLMCEGDGPCRVLRVKRGDFKRLMSGEADIGEVVMRAFILRRLGLIDNAQGGVVLVGRRDSDNALRLEQFLRRNGYPLRTLFLEESESACEARRFLKEHGHDEQDLPVVVCSTQHTLSKPTLAEVGDCLGLTELPDVEATYDVTVVGAGPAGLAAAVYAASEGLKTIVIEGDSPGGQAGTSSRIENYLGFPNGVSGWELAARAEHQAQKFGATLVVPRRASHLEPCEDGGDGYKLHLDQGPPVRTRSVVIACGARWRTLDLDNFAQFENRGIHYAATAVESDFCREKEIIVVGGGNSAGQAAVFLSGHAKCVHMLVRGEGLASSMSDYLVQRIEASDKINLRCRSQITGLHGDDWLREVTWQTDGEEPQTCPISHVFLMIGAVPNSDWLAGTLRRDKRGFVLTGSSVKHKEDESDCAPWRVDRLPRALEASLPGVFAVGDVRAGSVKRVASAVGEGSVCVQDLHSVLAQQSR